MISVMQQAFCYQQVLVVLLLRRVIQAYLGDPAVPQNIE
jgi:hypothetical protein